MPPTLQDLVRVRSGRAEALQRYYETLVDSLDRTPWFHGGQMIRASRIAVPALVLKEDTRPQPPRPGEENHEDRDDRFLADPEIVALYEEPMREKRQEEVPWDRERRQVRRAVVLGAPGGGKSFLTEMTAVELAHDALEQLRKQLVPLKALPIPIHLQLADLAAKGLPDDPAEALIGLLTQQYAFSPCMTEWLRTRLQTDQCWLILDALDQVEESNRPILRKHLSAMDRQGWRCHILLTCRTANFDRAWIPWGALTEYDLAPFDLREIRRFLEQWFGESDPRGWDLRRVIDMNFALRQACRNPLVATLTCLAHEEVPVTQWTRRVDLYARVLRGLARRAWKADPLQQNDPHVDDILRLLEPVAWTLFRQRPESNLFSNTEIVDALKATPAQPLPLVLRQQVPTTGLDPAVLAHVPTLLRDELLECGILVGAGLSRGVETQFSFLHRTFLEYLSARMLARQKDAIEIALAHVYHPAWQEVLRLLGATLGHRTLGYIARLLRENANDLCLRPLKVAFAASREADGKHMPASLPQEFVRCAVDIHLWQAEWLSANRVGAVRGEPDDLLEQDPSWKLQALRVLESGLWDKSKCEHVRVWVYYLRMFFRFNQPMTIHAGPRLGPLSDVASHLRALEHKDGCVGRAGARALGRIGSAEAVPALLRAMERKDGYVGQAAAEALGRIGSAEAVPALLRALEHKDGCVGQAAAARALGRIGSAAAVPALLCALEHKDGYVGQAAAEALGCIGSAEAVPALLRALERKDGCVGQAAAARALGRIGSAEAVPALLRALERKDGFVGQAAAEALGRIGSAEAVPALLRALERKDGFVGQAAAEALGRIGSAEIVPDLLRSLGNDYPDARRQARNALTMIGWRHRMAIPVSGAPANVQAWARSLRESLEELAIAADRAGEP